MVGERYQVLEPLAVDPYAAWYRVFDQEAEAEVRLRVVHPDLLPDEASRRRLVERLEDILGRGGRFLAPLLDVDRDGPRVYAVEPMPAGTSLRTLFDRRVAEGRRFRPDEVLPIVARLGAALAALPRGFRHGDIRPAHIWIRRDSLILSGGLLVSALPEGAVAAALQGDPLRWLYAPELGQGLASPTIDLYGVGLVVLEALAGILPSSPFESIPASLGGVGDALAGLLQPNPAARAGSLDALLSALSRQADAPVPILDVGPYRDERARSVRPLPGEATDPLAGASNTPSVPPGDEVTNPRIQLPTDPTDLFAGDALDAIGSPSDLPPQDPRDLTRRIAYTFTEEPAGDPPDEGAPAPAAPVDEEDAFITRPVNGSVPRARVIEGAAPGGTQEIALDQILEAEPLPAYDDPFPAAPAPLDELPMHELPGAPEAIEDDAITLASSETELVEDEPPPPRRRKNQKPKGESLAQSIPLEGLKPIPRPKRVESILPPPSSNPEDQNYVLFDDSGTFEALAPGALKVPVPQNLLAEEPSVTTLRPPKSERPRTGRSMLLGSLLMAVAIIAGSLLFATYRRAEAERARERALEERYQQIMLENNANRTDATRPAPNPPSP